MPNIENIDRLIDAIKTGDGRPEVGFNMGSFVPTKGLPDLSERKCGTACCIGGWVEILTKTQKDCNPIGNTSKFLDIEGRQANILCYATNFDWRKSFNKITAIDAIKVLENLKVTGRVDWSIV